MLLLQSPFSQTVLVEPLASEAAAVIGSLVWGLGFSLGFCLFKFIEFGVLICFRLLTVGLGSIRLGACFVAFGRGQGQLGLRNVIVPPLGVYNLVAE